MSKILFLGTGSICGVPEWNCDCFVCTSENVKDKRLRSSLFIELDHTNILIDFGPDLRTQLLKYSIKKFDYVFLTHAHSDHINGYMELSRQKNLIFEAHEKVLQSFDKRIGQGVSWLKTRSPDMIFRSMEKTKIENFTIETVLLNHKKDYTEEVPPCSGFVFRSSDFSFAYLTDYIEILEEDKLYDLDLIISDSTHLESKHGHVGVQNAVEIAKKLNPQRMLFTHISHTLSHEFLEDYLKPFENIGVAYDGLTIEF